MKITRLYKPAFLIVLVILPMIITILVMSRFDRIEERLSDLSGYVQENVDPNPGKSEIATGSEDCPDTEVGTIHSFERKYKFENNNAEDAFKEIQEDIPFPVAVIPGTLVDGEVTYSYADYKGNSDFKDYDFFMIEKTSIEKDGVKIGVLEGALSIGGKCDEQYNINLEAGDFNVCRLGERYNISDEVELDVENANRDKIMYMFSFKGDFTKDEVEALFSEMYIIGN